MFILKSLPTTGIIFSPCHSCLQGVIYVTTVKCWSLITCCIRIKASPLPHPLNSITAYIDATRTSLTRTVILGGCKRLSTLWQTIQHQLRHQKFYTSPSSSVAERKELGKLFFTALTRETGHPFAQNTETTPYMSTKHRWPQQDWSCDR